MPAQAADPRNQPRPDGKGGTVPGTPVFFWREAKGKWGNWCQGCSQQDVGTVQVELADGTKIVACYHCFMKGADVIKKPHCVQGEGSGYSCADASCIEDGDNRCAECGNHWCDAHMVIQGQNGLCKSCCDAKNRD